MADRFGDSYAHYCVCLFLIGTRRSATESNQPLWLEIASLGSSEFVRGLKGCLDGAIFGEGGLRGLWGVPQAVLLSYYSVTRVPATDADPATVFTLIV